MRLLELCLLYACASLHAINAYCSFVSMPRYGCKHEQFEYTKSNNSFVVTGLATGKDCIGKIVTVLGQDPSDIAVTFVTPPPCPCVVCTHHDTMRGLNVCVCE